jgi:hypothetical protein
MTSIAVRSKPRRSRTGKVEMNSPSWMCPSVPQTPVVCDKGSAMPAIPGIVTIQTATVHYKGSNIGERVKRKINNEDDNEPLRRTSSSLICGTGTSLITNFRGCVRSNQLSNWIHRCAQTYGIIPQSLHCSLNHGELDLLCTLRDFIDLFRWIWWGSEGF